MNGASVMFIMELAHERNKQMADFKNFYTIVFVCLTRFTIFTRSRLLYKTKLPRSWRGHICPHVAKDDGNQSTLNKLYTVSERIYITE